MAGEKSRSKKRNAGDGSYRKRTDGRYEVRGTTANGKIVSRYGKTLEEVKRKHRAALRELDQGRDFSAGRPTVAEFLDSWLEDIIKPSRAPKTHETYQNICNYYLKPELGQIRLDELTPTRVANHLQRQLDQGLSPRTVHHVRAVLGAALNRAHKWGIVTRNVASLVESPRQTPNTATPLTREEARRILDEARSHRLAALFNLALRMGLREGEILALRWCDLDLETRTLRVVRTVQRVGGKIIWKEPKTPTSGRSLTIPQSLVEPLQVHRARQALERAAAGSDWQEHDLVFPSSKGTPLDARNLLRTWHNLLQNAGLPRRSFHSTRDTAASLLLAEDVDVSDSRREWR